MSPVTSVFHAEVKVNIGLKDTVRVVASIPSIRCPRYKPVLYPVVIAMICYLLFKLAVFGLNMTG